MKKSTYHISQMDCPSEEKLILMKLDSLENIKKLDFDLENRVLTVVHEDENIEITSKLEELNLGANLTSTDSFDGQIDSEDNKQQSKLLWAVLIINFSFFLIEGIFGFISNSMGLVADSLDMFADAIVYGLSIWAVGAVASRKRNVARFSGYIQIGLAIIGLMEVVRRFVGVEDMPIFSTMIIVSTLALIANSVSLIILQKSKSNDIHMKASMIFTSNDIIINSGVILAGILVYFMESKYPDLIIGGVVFTIVIRGAVRILKL